MKPILIALALLPSVALAQNVFNDSPPPVWGQLQARQERQVDLEIKREILESMRLRNQSDGIQLNDPFASQRAAPWLGQNNPPIAVNPFGAPSQPNNGGANMFRFGGQ